MPDVVLSAFIRIATHPAIFKPPTPLPVALRFADVIRDAPSCVRLLPGPGHWRRFLDACKKANATGNVVPDAYLASLAMDAECELITTDKGFARFAGLRWRSPVDSKS